MDLPSKKAQIYSVVLQIIGLVIVSLPYLFIGGKPFKHGIGFYCDDESLKLPGICIN